MKNLVSVAAAIAVLLAVILGYRAGDALPESSLPKAKAPTSTALRPDASPPPDRPAERLVTTGQSLADMIQQLASRVARDLPALSRPLQNLTSADPVAREEAVLEVGFADDKGLLGPILHLLAQDPVAEVRAAAASALDIHGDIPQASLALVRALRDPDEGVREQALLSLKMHRNSIVEAEMRGSLAADNLPTETRQDIKLFLDRYYVRKDPFLDPLQD